MLIIRHNGKSRGESSDVFPPLLPGQEVAVETKGFGMITGTVVPGDHMGLLRLELILNQKRLWVHTFSAEQVRTLYLTKQGDDDHGH